MHPILDVLVRGRLEFLCEPIQSQFRSGNGHDRRFECRAGKLDTAQSSISGCASQMQEIASSFRGTTSHPGKVYLIVLDGIGCCLLLVA